MLGTGVSYQDTVGGGDSMDPIKNVHNNFGLSRQFFMDEPPKEVNIFWTGNYSRIFNWLITICLFTQTAPKESIIWFGFASPGIEGPYAIKNEVLEIKK